MTMMTDPESDRRERAKDRAAARFANGEGSSTDLLNQELEREGIYSCDSADTFERHVTRTVDQFGRTTHEDVGPQLVDTGLREKLERRRAECVSNGETFDAAAEARLMV